MVCGPWGLLEPLGQNSRGSWDHKNGHGLFPHPDGMGPLRGSRTIKPDLPQYCREGLGTSPSQPPAKRFQRHLIPSTPINFQPTLASIPTSLPHFSPSSSHTRPATNSAVRPSPIQQSRASPIVTSQQLKPVSSSSRRREELSPLPFSATQVFQRRDCWPIQVTREDPNIASESQDAMARLVRRVDRNSREVIMYANDTTIPGTASEEMAAKFSWYEDELINDLQRTFDYMGRDN
ncbi:hypothetical protein O181_020984 [Austropuccinia psidii MF-1]|uniref:Uncharacterized protein n=1 Tax=Austropuccinia psidii MF-1 TaxID=1389203 RepID=A0A9Q3GW83_9BASI|nr:hypothetical protein [Austropuccinia psidii MF-1]